VSGGFNLDEYVDVAERISAFYARYPEGSLKTGSPPQFVETGGKAFVVYHAQAFRHPDDDVPADGWAWEPVPGPTQFTRDSELQNAETAAWGRAIVACGFETKKIASRQEVRNRQGAGDPSSEGSASEPNASAASPNLPSAASPAPNPAEQAQAAYRANRKVPEDGGDSEMVVVHMGKHKNEFLGQVLVNDPGYVKWLAKDYTPKTAEDRRLQTAAFILTAPEAA
jgi:hypothetical protein